MATDPTKVSPSDVHDSNAAWLFRGVMLAVLMVGSANALSFFVRSRGWGSLLGSTKPGDEAIGFPLAVWEESSGYGAHPLQVIPFVVDIAAALLLGIAIGLVAIWHKATLNAIMDRFRRQGPKQRVRLQFSLRGLLITTVLAALAAALARTFTPRYHYLAAIYALGPAVLVAIAFLPRGLRWQQRVAILVPATVMLVVVAIVLGHALEIEVDKVMMGIFICWTPQSALAAIAITIWLLTKEYRALLRSTDRDVPH